MRDTFMAYFRPHISLVTYDDTGLANHNKNVT